MLKKQNISMPMTMAGIPTFSVGESIGGVKISPVHLLIFVVVVALSVKVLQVYYNL
jgi:preprotein translocase subunit Sec61beta